ncbi:hypothetical protein D4764_09G0008110 [Takifugu flavidus]|uniref:Uncharacterized protein n=1 Tax=Takifugu flavidus TaxID=433684 RepID=A0A5C6MNK3_9TELE|nr:hypothetical protein D4764_09G0008110 [Takifugu flavidus]
MVAAVGREAEESSIHRRSTPEATHLIYPCGHVLENRGKKPSGGTVDRGQEEQWTEGRRNSGPRAGGTVDQGQEEQFLIHFDRPIHGDRLIIHHVNEIKQ